MNRHTEVKLPDSPNLLPHRFHLVIPDNRPLVLGLVEITLCACHEERPGEESDVRDKEKNSPVGTLR